MTTIGDTVYQFDDNHRVYLKDRSAPVYREYWRPMLIVGEVKRSWLVTRGTNHQWKVAKAAVKTATDVDNDCWINDHRLRVADAVQRCADVGVLRAVAAAIGYDAEGAA